MRHRYSGRLSLNGTPHEGDVEIQRDDLPLPTQVPKVDVSIFIPGLRAPDAIRLLLKLGLRPEEFGATLDDVQRILEMEQRDARGFNFNFNQEAAKRVVENLRRKAHAQAPPPRPTVRTSGSFVEDWRLLLELGDTFTADDVNRAYRSKAKTAHPDNGGSTEAMLKLNEARRIAIASIGVKA